VAEPCVGVFSFILGVEFVVDLCCAGGFNIFYN